MKKVAIGAAATIIGLFAASGVMAQTATPSPTPSTSPTVTSTASPTPTGSVQGTSTVAVPSGAPATGHGGY